ncbi:sensor histidine kinase [Ruminococcus sp.]|uniref:sensor histidine kinase n=1 Tax=Ruminococcus sp. TaxID=41978 RepID=UPI0025D90D13|nr:sensor histidine kinase [Ruminococcus sp.]
MNKLWDKLIIFVCCVAILAAKGSGFDAVTAMLFAVIFSAIGQIFSKSYVTLGLQMIYYAVCLVNPCFCLAVPMIAYDTIRYKYYPLLFTIPISIACNFENLGGQIFPLIGCLLCCVTLSLRTIQTDKLHKELISTRDDSEELTMELVQKNKKLRREQDYEIYLATLKERNRIAREIHDNVGHMLTRSILQLGALTIINKDDNISGSLKDLSATLNDAMTSIRSSVHDLHDDSIALRPAVDECIRSMDGRLKIDCDYDFTETMPKDIKLCFIGIVKECLSNTARHSTGDKVKITIREHPALYQLTIQDNGVCSGEIKESGIGLSNMRERVSAVNGQINITAGQTGFKVFVSAPKPKIMQNVG